MSGTLQKTGAIFAFIMFIGLSLFAQAPELMSYQAVIRNSSGDLVVSQNVGVQISILQGTTSGTAVYVETHTPTTNANGLISLSIGGGTAVTGSFSAINWSAGPYFIKTETDPAGGTDYTISGTSQLLSVPFALHANTASPLAYGDFYSTSPGFSLIFPGTPVPFGQDGPSSGGISRISAEAFDLHEPGTYQVFFQVSVNEAGQLGLTLNGTQLSETVVGRATGTTQLVGMAIINTTISHSILTVVNPVFNSTALTISQNAGGASPSSAHLVITRLK